MRKMIKAVKQTKSKAKENGFILYEGPSMLEPSKDIVVIATLTSANDKTGNMIQTWILVKDEEPHHATKRERIRLFVGIVHIVIITAVLVMLSFSVPL